MVDASQEVAGVGNQVESIKKGVEETAAEQKYTGSSLNAKPVPSAKFYLRTKQDQAGVFIYSQRRFLGASKDETYTMDTIILVDGSFAYSLVHAKESPFVWFTPEP